MPRRPDTPDTGQPESSGILAFVTAAIVVAFLVAVGLGLRWAIRSSDAEDARAARAEARAFARANTICGSAPRRIIAHGASWSFGPWIEVICKDGTAKVVRP